MKKEPKYFKKALTGSVKERILMKLSQTGQRNKQFEYKIKLKRISKNNLTIESNDDIIEKLLKTEAAVIEKRIVP